MFYTNVYVVKIHSLFHNLHLNYTFNCLAKQLLASERLSGPINTLRAAGEEEPTPITQRSFNVLNK